MTAVLEKQVKDLGDQIRKRDEVIDGLARNLNTLTERISKIPDPRHPGQSAVFGAPHAVIGESSLSSRGFKFMNVLGVMAGQIAPENAKIEMDINNRLHKCIDGYNYDFSKSQPNRQGVRMLAPLASAFLHDNYTPPEFRHEMKALVCAGTDGADQDHMSWIKRKQLSQQGYGSKALSWLNELTGGAVVAPPEMGELIELLRNKEALVNAGARVVPLPPQGRMVYPRQTAASITYWVGENAPITESLIGTGEVTLQAKKLAVLIKAPNELIRFASPAAEALMRDDMTKSLALGLDLAGLEGQGGDNRPLGITLRPNINTVRSSAPAPSGGGDRIVGQDIYRMIAAVEESNAEMESFVMRPKTLYKYYQLRADAVSQGDAAGVFLFNLIREAGADTPPTLAGYPVVKSTQISQIQSQGTSGNTLTYVLGGMFSDLLIGMFGAIEFAATTMGDTAFINDQTWVRGILSADIAPRHEAAFAYCPFLSTLL